MSDEPNSDASGDLTGLNRRALLRTLGGTAAGIVAVTSTASAHQNQFFGCQEVCTDTDGNLAVVATGDGYECRPMQDTSVRDDTPWDWRAHCYRAADGEAVIGVIEEHVWNGATRDPNGDCELCLNPNDCASAHFDSATEVVDALDASDTCGVCAGNVVAATDCTSYGEGGGSDGTEEDSGDGDSGNGGDTSVTRLTVDGGTGGDFAGWSVAVDSSGERVIAGAPKTDTLVTTPTETGAAYVFDYDGSSWSQTATLTASDETAGNSFGWDVALDESGQTAVVGAPIADGPEADTGAVYVFEDSGSGWSETGKITASSSSGFDVFGYSVATDDAGDTVLVGAPWADPMGAASAGLAYAFQHQSGSWTLDNEISLATGDDDAVGSAVALDAAGDDGIVGAAGAGPDETGYASLVADSAGWGEANRFEPSSLELLDSLGTAVGVDDTADTIVAGAPGDQIGSDDNRGSVYLFEATGSGYQQTNVTASDGAADHEFGTAVDVDGDGDLTLVGAPGATDSGGTANGAAYVYESDGTSWTESTKLAPDSGSADDRYGRTVAVDESRQIAVVSAPGDDGNGTDAGAFYVHTL